MSRRRRDGEEHHADDGKQYCECVMSFDHFVTFLVGASASNPYSAVTAQVPCAVSPSAAGTAIEAPVLSTGTLIAIELSLKLPPEWLMV